MPRLSITLAAFLFAFALILAGTGTTTNMLVHALFEDQAGVNDWHQANVGAPVSAVFGDLASKLVYVATEEGVIAALNSRTGDIVWRQVLPRSGNEPELCTLRLFNEDHLLVSLCSSGRLLAWHAGEGSLMWEVGSESRFFDAIEMKSGSGSRSASSDGTVVVVLAKQGVTAYDALTGAEVWRWRKEMDLEKEKEKAGTDDVDLVAMELGPDSDPSISIRVQTVSEREGEGKGDVNYLDLRVNMAAGAARVVGSSPEAELQKLKRTGRPKPVLDRLPGPKACLGVGVGTGADPRSGDEMCLLFGVEGRGSRSRSRVDGDGVVHVHVRSSTFGLEHEHGKSDIDHDLPLETRQHGEVTRAFIDIRNLTLHNRDGTPSQVWRCLIVTEANTVALVRVQMLARDDGERQAAAVTMPWVRDEGMASSESAVFVDLPSMEEGAGGRTAHAHASETELIAGQTETLTHGEFGFHQLAVLLSSRSGKIFALHTASEAKGEVHWSRYFGPGVRFRGAYAVRLPLMREDGSGSGSGSGTEAEAEAEAERLQLVVVSVHGGRESRVTVIDPVSGRVSAEEKYAGILLHAAPLRIGGIHHGPMLVVDENLRVSTFPEAKTDADADVDAELKRVRGTTFVHSIDRKTGTARGFSIGASTNMAAPVWTLNLPGMGAGASVVAHVEHDPIDRIASPVRVLPDRTVLTKYLNPHAFAVATLGPAPAHTLSLAVVDGVTGRVLLQATQPGVRGPVTLAKSENVFVATYHSLHRRAAEAVVLELIVPDAEKEAETVAESGVFSSWTSAAPAGVWQAYTLPLSVECISATTTAHGITPKHVLLGLSGGQVLMLHRSMADPRRPLPETVDPKAAANQQGMPIPPYSAVLPAHPHSVISYHYAVAGLRGIVSAPSVLESTSLVLAYGIDSFFTRVTPAGAFDMLNVDFNYSMLLLSLAALAVLTPVIARLARRKEVAALWR